MGKNKAARNSFFFFMLDFRDKSPRKFDNMKDVADAANPHWQKMTPEQRKPFEDRAKADKKNQNVAKYTTTGVKIDLMQKREDELLAKVQRIKDDIENTIHVAIEGDRIGEQTFYLIHVNHYGFCNSNKQYIPAELAVTRFTLKNGVTPGNVHHAIIKPGPLPIGYSYQARKVCDESHQIEPTLGDDAESNLDQVTTGFMTFMNQFNNNQRGCPPPVFAQEKNKEVVENVLKNFCLNYGHEEDYIKVYPLEYLFFTLRNAVGDAAQPVYPSIPMCTLELEKDKYDFCKDIPCSYHTLSDVPYHCSRSSVIRLVYIICDNCCGDLGIELIPGQHVPSDANVPSTRSQSSASGYAASFTSSSTVIKAPSHRNPRPDSYFLSQQTESGMSTMSETSSVLDPNEYAGGYGYDSEYSQADAEEWIQPKQKHRRNENKQVRSKISVSSNAAANDLHFTSTSGDEFSQPTTSRQLAKPSAASARGTENKQVLSQISTSSNEPANKLHFTYPSADECSQPTAVNRRPTKLSAALMGGISELSIADSTDPSKIVLPVGRGRGRGIAANFGNKMA